MNIEKLSPESISKFVPNLVTEVDDERSLFDKLVPFLASARAELEAEYLGTEDFLSEAHNDYALKILVAKAFADAVPALDLIVTPTGMGVINTDNLAPASKERVERLITSLREYVRVNLALLVDICRTYQNWRESERGQYFCSSFISSLTVLTHFPEDIRPPFQWVHDNAMIIEKKLEMDYLGSSVVNTLRSEHNSGRYSRYYHISNKIVSVITQALIASLQGKQFPLWHYARQILFDVQHEPELMEMWSTEVGEVAEKESFPKSKNGGFFFS